MIVSVKELNETNCSGVPLSAIKILKMTNDETYHMKWQSESVLIRCYTNICFLREIHMDIQVTKCIENQMCAVFSLEIVLSSKLRKSLSLLGYFSLSSVLSNIKTKHKMKTTINISLYIIEQEFILRDN